MKRTIALLTTMAIMLLVATSVAIAAVISCPTGSAGFCQGTSGDDTMTGTDAIFEGGPDPDAIGHGDIINSLGGSDTLNARGADDILNGGIGNDKLDGGAGSDSYLFEGTWGVDTITADASGFDEIRFSRASTQPVVVDLVTSSSRDEAKSGTNTLNWVSTGLIESASGGVENDTLSGTNGSNNLHGGGGSDKLSGRDSHDYLSGDTGDDELGGGAGKDDLDGGSGNDTISSVDNGADGVISCGDGFDTVNYDRGFDVPASDCEKKTAFPIAASTN